LKNNIFLSTLVFFLTQNLWATTTCQSGEGKVVLNENYTMKVSGLATKGIASGTYSCLVVWAGPGTMSTQREIQCRNLTAPGIPVLGWMIEGLDELGHKAASVALYNNGAKVFEAGCTRK
jgi:hypothetical protein